MATMNISVPDPMRDWVQQRIEGGRYASVSDYVRDLIRRDQEADDRRRLSVEEIRQSIEDSQRIGTTRSADAVFDRIEAKLRARLGER